MEYTDNSGVDLLQFIIQTLHKNQKDRAMLLKIERELINLVRDSKWVIPNFSCSLIERINKYSQRGLY